MNQAADNNEFFINHELPSFKKWKKNEIRPKVLNVL